MRYFSRHVKRLALSFCLSPLLLGLVAWAAEGQLTSIQFNAQTQSLVMTNSAPVTASVNSVNIGRTKRIIIDLNNAEVGVGIPRDAQLLQQLSRQWPNLKNVSVNQFGGVKPIVRILLDIDGINQVAALAQSRGTQLELRLGSPLAYPTPAATGVPENSISAESISISELKQTLVLLNQKYDQLLTENQSLKGQLQQWRQQRQSADYDSAELQRLRTANVTTTEQLKRQTADADRLKSQLDQLQAKFSTLQNEHNQLRSAAAKTPITPSVPGSQLDELKKQVDDARVALAKSVTTINEQNQQIANLKKHVEQLSAESELTNREQMTLLSNKLDEKDATIRQLQQDLDKANQKTAAPAQQATPTAIGNDRSADAMRQQLEDMRNQYKTLVTEYNRLKQDPSEQGTLFAENEALKTKQKELEKRVAEQTNIAEKRKREYDALWKEAQNLKVSAKPMTKASPDLKPEVDRLTRANTDLEAENQRIAQLVTKLQADLEAAQSEAKSQSASSAPQANITPANLAKENKRLTGVVDLMKKDNQMMAEEREKALQQVKQIQLEMSALKKQTGVKKDGNVLEQTTLQNRVSELEQETAQLKTSLKSLEDENMRLVKAAESKTDAPVSESEKTLQQQLSDTRQRLVEMEARYKKILGEYDKLSQQKTGQKSAIAKAEPARILPMTHNPAEAEKQFLAAQKFEQSNQSEAATTAYAKAVELDPENGRYVAALGAALANKQKYDDAIALLKSYLTKHPERLEIHNQLGKVYTLDNQLDAAKASFAEALSIGTLNNYATTLKKLGQTDQAEGLFKLALSIDPSDSEVLFNLGNLYNSTNKLQEALANYNKALALRPDFAEAHYNVGLVYSKMGEAGQAATHLERFLQLTPNAANAESVRAYIKKLKGA